MINTVWARFSADPATVEIEEGTAKAVLSSKIRGKEELLHVLASELSFPSYFGVNWDALEEALLDLLPNQGRRIVILHTGMPLLTEDEFSVYLQILKEAALQRQHRREPPIEAIFPAGAEAQVKKLLDRV